jgi:4-amino-4-deoxy-L-arabinose transferase-like glycosyltransferase
VSSMSSSRPAILRDPWVVGALAVGLAVRLLHLGAAPLWFDEVMTADWVARPWREMLAVCLADNHPPLYFVLVKLVRDLFGDAPWLLRLPSALLGTLAIPLAGAAADALANDRRTARWAAWFAALSPFLVHHGQEARMYALVGTLAAANLLALARFTTGRTARLGILFGASAVALVATHYYTVFYVGGAVLAAIATRPRELRAWLPAAAVASGASTVALVAAALLARHQAGGSYALGWAAVPGALWSLVSGYALLPDTFALHSEGARAGLRYLPIALAAAPALALCAAIALRSLGWRERLTLALPIATALLAPFAIRLVLGVAVNPRYFQTIVPAVLVLLAAGAGARIGWPRVATGAGIGVGVLLATGTAMHLADPGHGREDIGAATAWLDAHVPADQPLLVTSREMAYLARFHWAGHPIVDYPRPPTVVDQASADQVADHLPWHGNRAIYVFGRAWVSDPEGALERDVRQRFASCGGVEARGIRIYCLDHSSTAAAEAGGNG